LSIHYNIDPNNDLTTISNSVKDEQQKKTKIIRKISTMKSENFIIDQDENKTITNSIDNIGETNL